MKRARILPYLALVLSVVAAALDFISGTPWVQLSTMYVMGEYAAMGLNPAQLTLPLYALGSVVLITGIIGITRLAMRRMLVFGSLMLLYGGIMVGIGLLMLQAAGMTLPSMVLLGEGMLVSGGLMLLNGSAMIYSTKVAKQM